ncbi:MAG TPA: rubrerythrin family protein, partial [Thermoleophilia bacterium]|nr:rubrerythrin family protein [Thermoleophilia bacterium]
MDTLSVEELERRLPHADELHAMDLADLKAAFAGESQAAEKYLVFAEKAEADGLPNVANLFRAISFAETRHARNHLRVMAGVNSTADNLQTAFEGESFEIDQMYPAYVEVAKLQGDKQAFKSMHWALKAEMDHKRMYAEAREKVLAGGDVAAQTVRVCTVCGHTIVGDAP